MKFWVYSAFQNRKGNTGFTVPALRTGVWKSSEAGLGGDRK
jgi:hypothetical protein